MADGAARFGQGFSGPALLRYRLGWGRSVRLRGCHPLRPAFPGAFRSALPRPSSPALQPRARLDARGLGSSPFARRYSGSHCCFPLLRLLRCFSSSGWQPLSVGAIARAGFPHSDIRGSKAVRASPRLFAACRVLLRLREPRHPPCALRYLSRTARVPPHSLAASGGTSEYPRSCRLSWLFQVIIVFL